MEENTPNVAPVAKQKNGIGTAGFIVALIGLIFCWVPVLDYILWLVGAILSIIGLFKKPRGLAIAGTIISAIVIILIIVVIGAVVGGAALLDL